MAIKEEVILEVKEVGMDEYTDKANAMAKANENIASSTTDMQNSLRGSSNAVLENGGAMGLLNDLTGGYAMMVKDAVEASVLFTKSQKLAAIQQKIYTAVVGASSGAMKIFRIALVSTGVGAIVVAIGMLIANFDKVKKAVMNLIPGLSIIGDVIGGIIDAVTDFIGVTSDATRALDKMVSDADASLKKNEHFLEANGDKYDQYTQKKIQANIDYNKKVKELAEDEELTDKEKLERIADFREKANRQIVQADKDREAERDKIRQAEAEKEEQEAKRRADEYKRRQDALIAKEKERVTAIEKILEDFRKKEEDINAKSNLDKINLEEQRALDELNRLKATEEEKAKVRDYYNNRRKEEEQALEDELNAIREAKNNAVRELDLDQKEWEVENETDPLTKLQKERELLEERAALELGNLQKDIDNAKLSAQERANAEMEYARIKQDLDQALASNESKQAEEQKTRDEAVAQNKKSIAMNTAQALAELGGKSAEFAKGVAVGQAVMDTYKGAVSAYTGMVQAIPGPVGIAGGVVAAAATVAMGIANVKKILATKPVEKGTPSGGSGGSGAAVPSAPSFNLVQGTGSNQIAETIAGQDRPLQAYVVSSSVSTAQSLDRNIVDNSRL